MTTRPEQIGIMKAKPLTEDLVRRLGPTCFAQPKLRGQRCRVVWLEDEEFPLLLSSYGNPFFFLEHIQAELAHLPRLPYDGELYVHTWSQQEINSVLNRTTNRHEKAHLVEYHIFDLINRESQSVRLNELDEIDEVYSNRNKVLFTPDYTIESIRWISSCERFLAEGYEGIILRSINNYYSPLDGATRAQRPSTILKFKPNEYDDYLIIGTREGEGWCEDMLGAFLVQSLDGGASFYVGTGRELTKEKRQYYWSIRNELPGKLLNVRHERNISTADGIPICTSAYKVKGL